MNYKQLNGSLLSVTEGHIIHGCNAKGKMASGVAKAIREEYPQVYNVYKDYEENYGLKVGSCHPIFINNKLVVWNLITQENYGYDKQQYVSYEAIENSLDLMERIIDKFYGMFYSVPKNINFPLIGSGLGGGDWKIIEEIILRKTQNYQERTLWTI